MVATQIFFEFSPRYLGKIRSNLTLTNIFQYGLKLNHQLEIYQTNPHVFESLILWQGPSLGCATSTTCGGATPGERV